MQLTLGVYIGLAVLGRAVSHWIPASPATDPGLKINWNPF